MSQSKSPWIIDVAEADFEREVIGRSHDRPVVVDFWAPWCGPCRALGPVLERIAEERNGDFVLAKINTDEAPNLAGVFRIEAIPSVKAFRNGKLVLEFTGVLPERQLHEFIDRACPNEAERVAQRAASLETSDPIEAEALYRGALSLGPGQHQALVGLARLLLARGAEAEAIALLDRVTPGSELASEVDRLHALLDLRRLGRQFGDETAARHRVEAQPDNAEARYQLGCILAAAGRYPEALTELLLVAERDKKLGASRVREAMVQIFHVIGVRSELADEYRDRLARVLY